MMGMKYYIYDHEMEEKTTSINTGWGDYKVTVSGISTYICPECGEMILDSKDSIIIQKFNKNLKETEVKDKLDVLSLTEVAGLLSASN